MKIKSIGRRALVLGALVVPCLAQAHPLHGGAGFGAGFTHPFAGIDHALAMLAVGMWAAQLGRRAMLGVPLAFLAVMSAGAMLAFAGVGVPLVEAGIAASVLAFGLLVAFAVRLPLAAGLALVGAFALLHGHAHGADLPAAAFVTQYVAGFALATTMLLAIGAWAGTALRAPALQLAGASVTLFGIALIAGA